MGENGPLLLQDFHLIDLLSHFDRNVSPRASYTPKAVERTASTRSPSLSTTSASQTFSNKAKNIPSQSASRLSEANPAPMTALVIVEASVSSSRLMKGIEIWSLITHMYSF
jgi:hypothetical protein